MIQQRVREKDQHIMKSQANENTNQQPTETEQNHLWSNRQTNKQVFWPLGEGESNIPSLLALALVSTMVHSNPWAPCGTMSF